MMDSDGNIVTYIGQPWHNPAGTLIVETPEGKIAHVLSKGFSVSGMPYEDYAKWKKL